MKTSKIIFLNGVTSSGKTTISKAIQEIAKEQFYYLSNDMFFPIEHQMLHDKYIEDTGDAAKDKYMAEAIVMMYRFAKIVAEQGINIIIDGMLEERSGFVKYYERTNYDILLDIFTGFNIYMVEVYCPLEECRQRNIVRGDRSENQSQNQHDIMNKKIKYDFFVDTSIASAIECAEKILKEVYHTE